MDELKKIPQTIWETDCRYCCFRVSEENFAYGSRGKYETPCEIYRYEGNCMIWKKEINDYLTEHEAYKAHCPSCRPTEGFGICATCEYFNPFHAKVEDSKDMYCTLRDGSVNRRNTMPHIKAGYRKEVTHCDYTYFTCDKYKARFSSYPVKDNLIKSALAGRIPKNFDPETLQPLEYIEGVPIEEWNRLQKKQKDNNPENLQKRKLQDAIKQKMKRKIVDKKGWEI